MTVQSCFVIKVRSSLMSFAFKLDKSSDLLMLPTKLTFCSLIALSAALITDLLHNTDGLQRPRSRYICILQHTASSRLKTCSKQKRNRSNQKSNGNLHGEIYILYSSGDWCFIKLLKFSWSKLQKRVLESEIYEEIKLN